MLISIMRICGRKSLGDSRAVMWLELLVSPPPPCSPHWHSYQLNAGYVGELLAVAIAGADNCIRANIDCCQYIRSNAIVAIIYVRWWIVAMMNDGKLIVAIIYIDTLIIAMIHVRHPDRRDDAIVVISMSRRWLLRYCMATIGWPRWRMSTIWSSR